MYKINDVVKYNNQEFHVHKIFNSGKMDIRRIGDNACVLIMPEHLNH
jgi:hypothetical protein